jgi:pyruvate,water dikinase
VRELPFKWWLVTYAQFHALVTAPRYSFWQCADTFYKEFPGQVSRYQEAMSIDFATASYDELMACFQISEQCFLEHACSTTPGIMDYCYFLILALSEMMRRWADDRDQSKFGALLSGLSTRTVQENIEIWRIARRIAESPHLQALFRDEDPARILAELPKSPEGATYLSAIRAFIVENGHRGGSERDVAFPRWRHRPELLISALRTLSSGDASSDPELTEARMRERRERTTREVAEALRRKPGGRWKSALFQLVLRWTLKYVRMRDDQRYYADYYMGARHDIFLAVGARLVDRQLIQSPDEVFFLGLQEIDDLWGGRLSKASAVRRIQARRTQHQKYSREAPSFYIRAGLPLVSEEELRDSSALTGIPASSGRVHARARVCRTLEDTRRLQKGEILVATATDPGWTAVFSIIAGVVVETGGPLAHATLVSREYGIPCVTNVNRATERIADGAMITLDGNAGRILLHEPATAEA